MHLGSDFTEHWVSSVLQAEEEDCSRSALSKFIEALGFNYFVYAGFKPTDSVRVYSEFILNGYPEAWRQRYDEKGYSRIDPVVLACRRSIHPLNWSYLPRVDGVPTDRALPNIVMDEARQFGLMYGWSIPLHGPGGSWSLLSIASRTADDFFENEDDPRLWSAYSMLTALHTTILEDSAHIQALGSNCSSLTPREQEVLIWSAEGKTTWETSLILSISDATVRFHIKNAVVKLEASNKTNAVTKAILYGLI